MSQVLLFTMAETVENSRSIGVSNRGAIGNVLFHIWREALNVAAKQIITKGFFANIVMSNSIYQQVMVHYTDDTTLIVKGTEEILSFTIKLL